MCAMRGNGVPAVRRLLVPSAVSAWAVPVSGRDGGAVSAVPRLRVAAPRVPGGVRVYEGSGVCCR